ncbi:hypothetical protein R2TS_10550 [Enterobacter asburiae]|nr:hypothetical protein R2TS_10550 [Enterobacter asburiae]
MLQERKISENSLQNAGRVNSTALANNSKQVGVILTVFALRHSHTMGPRSEIIPNLSRFMP